jgi:tetratricopeptide (TPR) repeat protein
MRFRVVPVFVIASVFFSAHPSRADEMPWKEIRSPHFRVITNGSDRDGRHVAKAFEQMRSTFANQFTGFRLDSAAPLLLLAPENESTAKMLMPEFWEHEGPKYAGVFFHTWETENAVVRLDLITSDRINPDTFNVVYHEYVHSLLHLNFRWLPRWLDEGLAEFYGFTRYEGSQTFIGAPPRSNHYLDVLYRHPPLPLVDFLEKRSSYSRDEGDTHLFYAQAWALTHFLIMGPGMDRGDRLKRFFNALQRGTEQKKAFQDAFGDLAAVQKAYENYLNRFAFTAGVVNDIPQVDDKSFSFRTMTLAETKTDLGSFFAARRKWKESRELAEAAIASDAKLGPAHELLGFIDLNDGRDQEALREFTSAIGLDGKLYRSLYIKTMLSPLSQSKSAEDRQNFQDALTKVLDLNSAFAPAYVELAKSFVAQGDLARALSMAKTAEKDEPSRSGYHVLTGQILLRMGHPSEAATYAAYVATRWFGPDHDEAIELWSKVPADKRPVQSLPDVVVASDVHIAEGTVKSVLCGDKKIAVTLEQGGQVLTFRQPHYALGFSDTFWEGSDHFTPCFHNVGARAVVRYKAAADKSYAGDIVSLAFRDDLPPAPSPAALIPSPPAEPHN